MGVCGTSTMGAYTQYGCMGHINYGGIHSVWVHGAHQRAPYLCMGPAEACGSTESHTRSVRYMPHTHIRRGVCSICPILTYAEECAVYAPY
jgi:hypothetical protein